MNLMKWPGTTDKPNNPDLSKLSDDELDDLVVKAGLMEQDDLDQQRDMKLVNALAKLAGGPPDYHSTLRGLMKLRHEGQFPLEAQDLYDRLRSRALAEVKAARKAGPKVTPSPADIPADMSLAGWLKARWTSADEAVRNALQAVASAVGASIPLSRTRNSSVGVKDPGSAQRTESEQQPNHGESVPLESPTEKEEPEEPGYHDPPEWHDAHADGWTPCSSIHEAFRSDEEWY